MRNLTRNTMSFLHFSPSPSISQQLAFRQSNFCLFPSKIQNHQSKIVDPPPIPMGFPLTSPADQNVRRPRQCLLAGTNPHNVNNLKAQKNYYSYGRTI
jgi:hypothetical protein